MEVLVHSNLRAVPEYHGVIAIDIPNDLDFEQLSMETMTGWGGADFGPHRRFGDRWLQERRSAVLMVPSVVLQGREQNILINPAHPDFPLIQAGLVEPVFWDARLFQGR
jgi:RES domain-containing protein